MITIGAINNYKACFNALDNYNGHILITGKSGSGKTLLAENLILEIIKNGGTIIALDLHKTLSDEQLYPGIRDAFTKHVHNIDAYVSGIPCPLFTPIIFKNGRCESEVDTVNSITEIIAKTLHLQSLQKATLKKAVKYVFEKQLYQKLGIVALNQALIALQTEPAINVKDKLEFLTGYNTLVHGNDFIHQNKINILRLSEFALSTQTGIAEIILSYLWRQVSSCNLNFDNLYIFIDEFQNLSMDKNSSIPLFLSEGRKFSTNLLLATQSLSMCFTPAAQKYLLQSGLQIYFRPTQKETPAIARMLDFRNVDTWISILNSLPVGSFIASAAISVNGRLTEQPLKLATYISK